MEPIPGGGITDAETKFIGPYGEIKAEWRLSDGGEFHLKLWVPPNSRAVVKLPQSSRSVEVGSGFHEFHD